MTKQKNFWQQLKSSKYIYFYDGLSDSLKTKFEVDFLSRIFKKNQKLIEFGCGTGRTLIPLLKKGFHVSGLDISTEMLEKLNEKLNKNKLSATIYQKDLTKLKIPAKFDGANLSQRTLNFITNPETQKTALKNIATILKKGSTLVVNLCPGKPSSFCKSQPKLIKTESFTNSISGERVDMWESWKVNPLNQTFDIVNEFRENKLRCKVTMKMRIIFVQEMKNLLELTGFKVLYVYGDYKKHPFTQKSTDLIFVAEKH